MKFSEYRFFKIILKVTILSQDIQCVVPCSIAKYFHNFYLPNTMPK